MEIIFNYLNDYSGNILFCVCPVAPCTMAPPTVEASSADQQGIGYGDVTNYTCHVGYRMPDDVRWDTVICDNAEWRCPLPDCTSQYIHTPVFTQ